MTAAKNAIVPQQLQNDPSPFSMALCMALELLSDELNYGSDMPGRRKGVSRQYAELREARSLISSLKYPDRVQPLTNADLSWALKIAKEACRGNALFDSVARELGIDLAGHHPAPVELSRKIANELELGGRAVSAAPLAMAV